VLPSSSIAGAAAAGKFSGAPGKKATAALRGSRYSLLYNGLEKPMLAVSNYEYSCDRRSPHAHSVARQCDRHASTPKEHDAWHASTARLDQPPPTATHGGAYANHNLFGK